MARLTADELLGATALPRERMQVPELGPDKYLIVQGMSGRDRDAFEMSLWKGPRGQKRNLDNFRARLVVKCLVDEDGKRLYEDAQAEQLGNIRVDVLTRIVAVAQRLSGISDQDAEELGKASGDPKASDGSSSN